MIFLKASYATWILLALSLTAITFFIVERKFFKWIENYWFLKRSPLHWIGSALVAAGICLLAVILMDPRSGEIKVKGKVRQDRTIILIDTSTSMLAEDVRPNRLEKAVMVAKHFVRKAVGHQISVMVFADIAKKLVPFTTDVDLLDSRIDSVRTLRNMNAGSSIGLAIEEAVQYFDVKDKAVSGNIIVITDGEDNAETEKFKVPDGISLVLIGIGTKEGGPIPMKDNMGFMYGNKKQAGQTVVTKLNEGFFQNAVKGVKNGRSFIVKSYDLPTDQILGFLDQRKLGEKDGDNMIRPVAMEIWAIPGVVLLSLGILLRSWRPFALSIFLLMSLPAHSAKEIELSPEILQRLEQMRQGQLDQKEKVNLADQLAKAKAHKLAQEIYAENLGDQPVGESQASQFNWATSELESGKVGPALQRYGQLDKVLPDDSPLKAKIRDNVRKAMVASQKQKQDKKEDQKESDKKDQSENKDQQQKPSEGKGEGKPQDGKEEDNKNPFDPKNKDKPEEKPGDKKDQDSQGDEEKKDEEKKEPTPDEGDEKKPRPKVSPLLEQLKQDDRKLQNKLLDVSTQKRTPGKRKDW